MKAEGRKKTRDDKTGFAFVLFLPCAFIPLPCNR